MFTSTFATMTLASFLACAVTTIGIYVINKYEQSCIGRRGAGHCLYRYVKKLKGAHNDK